MKHTKNTIIRASAGSGKTYQLSNRFLQRVFDAPSADKVPEVMDTILASTFTRKAAGEITDRIITKFAAVALDSDAREKLRGDICYPDSVNESQELQERLAILAKNLYRLRVGTIDSYFSKVARAFELELGLPPGWSILDDSQYDNLLTEAIREVLEDRTKKSGVEKCLTALQQFEGRVTIVNDVLAIAEAVLPLVRVSLLRYKHVARFHTAPSNAAFAPRGGVHTTTSWRDGFGGDNCAASYARCANGKSDCGLDLLVLALRRAKSLDLIVHRVGGGDGF